MKNKVSIVSINLNNANGLLLTLISIQKHRDDATEVIVVDGLSSDGSQDVIVKYGGTIDSCICEHDQGIYDAMNKGLAMATGEWIIFINSGDEILVGVSEIRKELDDRFRIIYGVTVVKGDAGRLFVWGKKLVSIIDVIVKPPFFHQAIFYNKKYISSYPTEYLLIADRVMTYRMLHDSKQIPWKFIDCEIASFCDGGVSSMSGREIINEEREFLTVNNNLLTSSIKWQLTKKNLIYILKILASKMLVYNLIRKVCWRLRP